MSNPTVSVIMPFLNSQAFLAEAIDSVLGQETPWELLLVDDGSVDGSGEIARGYASRHSAISVMRHDGGAQRGASASRNLALYHARAPLLAFLDSDDVWLPGMLSKQCSILERERSLAFVYANAERWHDFSLPYDPEIGSLGNNYLPPLIPAGSPAGFMRPPQLLDYYLADESMTPCMCTVVVRTEVARRLGGFEDSFQGLYDDQVFYAKIALHENVWVNLDCVARYRKHPASTCAQADGGGERAAFFTWLSNYRAQEA